MATEVLLDANTGKIRITHKNNNFIYRNKSVLGLKEVFTQVHPSTRLLETMPERYK
ncbi:hypothetical protein SynSYN20_03405 [Synechococcus sp. SYN20]|nr:hypothetical protein SynSYN20_03405 [Synechococcus sp. SYN20]